MSVYGKEETTQYETDDRRRRETQTKILDIDAAPAAHEGKIGDMRSTTTKLYLKRADGWYEVAITKTP